MVRQIIKIDDEKCNGCGLCASACHEGAISLTDGKARLLRDDYCDGLGNCLPVCPTGAITFEEREAAAFDEAAVKENRYNAQPDTLECGCPGTHSKSIVRHIHPSQNAYTAQNAYNEHNAHNTQFAQQDVQTGHKAERGFYAGAAGQAAPAQTHLNQWPVQIKLVPQNAPYFKNANLLVAADCAAYAYGNFHNDYMKNRITLIGCPKLDDSDYSEKLTEILKHNEIKSVTVARMIVPCCGGIEHAVTTALKNCGKLIPWQIVTISTDGDILD